MSVWGYLMRCILFQFRILRITLENYRCKISFQFHTTYVERVGELRACRPCNLDTNYQVVEHSKVDIYCIIEFVSPPPLAYGHSPCVSIFFHSREEDRGGTL